MTSQNIRVKIDKFVWLLSTGEHNMMKDDLIMDCYFEFEGETIGVRVKDDKKPIRMMHGVEKMSGFFDFYDENGYCGTEAFYEDFENMSPVRSHIAKKYYIEMKQRER